MLDHVALTSSPLRRLGGRYSIEQWRAGIHVAPGLTVRAFNAADAQLRASAFVNANRFVYGANYPLLAHDEYKQALADLGQILERTTGQPFITPLDDWHVTRAELARDFAVPDPQATIRSLAHSWWPRGQFRLRWFGREAPTLYIDGKSYRFVAYDKSAELWAKRRLEIPPTVRIELRARADALRNSLFKDVPTTFQPILEDMRPDAFRTLRSVFYRHFPFDQLTDHASDADQLGSIPGVRGEALRRLYSDVQTRGVEAIAQDAQDMRALRRNLQSLVDRGVSLPPRPLEW